MELTSQKDSEQIN